jgi:uncharacterized protein (TIGR02246 family)
VTAEEQIRAAIDSFTRAYRAKDLAALLGLYGDDLIKDRAGAPPEGKQRTAERVRGVFDAFDTDIEVEVAEIRVSGDMAFARGSFIVTLTPRDGRATTTLRRRYLEIWSNETGAWRVIRTMDNEAPWAP